MKFVLPRLSYAYDACEPYIDAQTMELHYIKHHQTYINQLNAVVEQQALENYSLEHLITSYKEFTPEVGQVVRNHGGGHFNHSFFWPQMNVNGKHTPVGEIAKAISAVYKDYDHFKIAFEAAAKSVFGSGWAWLCVDQHKNIKIITTPNQDCPLMFNMQPIMGLDVWEHAYYLKYQNRRPDYIAAWWHVLDWEQIEETYKKVLDIGK